METRLTAHHPVSAFDDRQVADDLRGVLLPGWNDFGCPFVWLP